VKTPSLNSLPRKKRWNRPGFSLDQAVTLRERALGEMETLGGQCPLATRTVIAHDLKEYKL
jgi:hypothetical protein